MNSRTEALLHLFMSIVIMAVLSVAAYYIGVNLLADSILNNAQAMGLKIPKLVDWKRYYLWLVLYMGIIAEVVLLLWIILSHWLLSSSDSTGVGKRWLWILLGIINFALCAAVPYLYNMKYSSMTMDITIPLLFAACHGLAGYWGGSILVTSDKYKYTPIFADFVRS